MKRWLAGLLVLGLMGIATGVTVTIAMLHDGPTAGPALARRPQSDPGATRPPKPALARFYSQQLDWSECGEDLCSVLEVPLDYRKPSGETIGIAVLMRPASAPTRRVGYLVVNPGGPGASGTSYARSATTFFRRQLTERFDFVGFDPRGVGDSSPIDCLTDAQLDAYVAGDPDPDTDAEELAYAREVRRFGRGCVRLSGDVVAHVSTIEAARDIDVLRAALGEASLDYFGASYGTELGATYADLFPDRVGRFVLDGAVDLHLSARDQSLQQAAGFQTALEAYVANCVETTDACFLGDSVDQGLSRIEEFLASVEASPLDAGDRQLNIGNAVYGISAPLYDADYWYLLSNGLKNAFEGDGALLLLLSDSYTARDPGGDGYSENLIEANLAINCLDDPYSIRPSEVPAQLADFESASRTFGRAFAWGLTTCGGFPARSTEKPRDVRAAGAPPIVVVGTTRDPATPIEWAEALADQLESGVLIRRDGDGHTGYDAGNECVDSAVEAYLLDGLVPQDGLSC